jgi:hypothetical protein
LSIERLRRISRALDADRVKAGAYVSPKIATADLSWRVRLLPWLGYAELYSKFNLGQAWDSPTNLPLLDQIPEEFRSPDRLDSATCIQLVTGRNLAFEGQGAFDPESCSDGLENTLLIVEVNPELAKPWTAPGDYEFNPDTLQRDWFGYRGDCVFAVFGGSTGVRRIAADIADDSLWAMLTPRGGESLSVADSTTYAHPTVESELRGKLAQQPLVRQLVDLAAGKRRAVPTAVNNMNGTVSAAGDASSSKENVITDVASASTSVPPNPAKIAPGRGMPPGMSPASSATQPAAANRSSVDIRREPPSEEQLEQASTIVRDLYSQEFKNAKLDKDKRDFAKKLIEDVERIEADSAGRFVLLRAARDVAAKAGDVTVAIEACDRLGREFRVDILSMKLKALEQAVVNLAAESELAPLYDNSLKLGDEALELDDFKAAQSLYRLAMNAARRGRSAEREYLVNLRENDLRETRVAYQRITDHVHTLVRAPEDPAANAAVGRYYLLLKRDWDRGLPMAARGDNALLRKLAESDLAQPTDGEAMVAVGDQWWDFAEKLSVETERSSGRIRARHWYEAAQPMLGASLQKIRVEKRIAEIKREQDKAEGKLPATAGRGS